MTKKSTFMKRHEHLISDICFRPTLISPPLIFINQSFESLILHDYHEVIILFSFKVIIHVLIERENPQR